MNTEASNSQLHVAVKEKVKVDIKGKPHVCLSILVNICLVAVLFAQQLGLCLCGSLTVHENWAE